MKILFVLVTAIEILVVTHAVLANPVPGWADPSSVPFQHSAASSVGALVRDKATNEACLVTGSEMAEGHNLVQAGRVAEGRAKLESALSALERAGARDSISYACLMNAIGFTEVQQRRADLAIEWFQRALELKPLPGALLARLTSNLASAYSDLNRLDRAEELARRAIQLSERALGPDHSETLFPRMTLASVRVARGEYAEAEPVLRRILYLAERSWRPSSYEVALAAGNLAFVYLAQDRYSLARELFEKSLAGFENNPIRSKDELPLVQANLAVSCAGGGQHQAAQMWLERALAQAEQELTPEDAAWPVILERLAMARFLLKDYESGRQTFDRALDLIEARDGPGSSTLQSAFERYSEVLSKVKDRAGARMLEVRRRTLAQRH